MMHHELMILASLAAVYIPVLISPGPNFLVVTQVAVDQTRRHALYTAAGVATGSTLMAGLAAAGMGLMLAHFGWFIRAVEVFGGAYLIAISWKIWRQAMQPMSAQAMEVASRNLWQSYLYGLATNLSNPKALVFFVTIFASLVTPNLPGWVRIAGVAVICSISMSWNLILANCFSNARAQRAYCDAKHIINRVTSVVLLIVGIKLIGMW